MYGCKTLRDYKKNRKNAEIRFIIEKCLHTKSNFSICLVVIRVGARSQHVCGTSVTIIIL